MKKTVFVLLLMISGLIVLAQEKEESSNYKTLFGDDKISHGGYGGLMVNYSQIDGQDAMLVGLRGAWIINHNLALGIAGYGFANDLQYYKTIDGYTDKYNLAGGYGGLLIEPIIGAKHPVHVSFPILIGAGGIALVDNYYNYGDEEWNDDNWDENNHPYRSDDADAYFVFEPGLELEFNLVKFMRLSVGGYYRYTSDLELADTKSDVLNGFSGGVSLKFGKF